MGYSNYVNLLEELENTKQMIKQHLLLIDKGMDSPVSASSILCVVAELEKFQEYMLANKLPEGKICR